MAAVPPPSPQTAEHHGHPVGHPRVLQDPPCDRGIRRRELHGQALDVGTYSLKDLAEPTRIWRIAGDTAPPRATPARRTNVQPTRTSFVGRTAELDRLRDLGGQPGLLTVRGPGHRLEILGVAETHPEVRHNLPSALTNVGYAYQIAGELQTAEAHLQRSAACSAEMGLWTSHALARCNLAEVALLRDRHKEARDQALTALRVAPPGWGLRAATMSMLARAHAALNDREAALATGREALREYPTSPDPFNRAELELLLATLPELRVATRPGDPAPER